MAMSLVNARGAIKALKTSHGLKAAYDAYAAGHDDKHRCKSKAYSNNFGSDTGNEPNGFYQKKCTLNVPVLDDTCNPVLVKQERKVWSTTITEMVTLTKAVASHVDISKEDELLLIKTALSMPPPKYYQNTRDSNNTFIFACYIPAGFSGFAFNSGGLNFPKQSTPCNAMAIVLTKSPNVRIITHYPTSQSAFGSWTELT